MRSSVWFIVACLFGSQAAFAVTLPDCNAIKAWAAPVTPPADFRNAAELERARGQVAGPGESVYRVELRRFPDRTQLVVHRRLVDGRISAQDPTLHSERPLPQSEDVRAARQLKALVCRGIPPGVQRNQLCPADTERRIAINSNVRPVWLAGEVEVAVEATTGMTRVVLVDLERR